VFLEERSAGDGEPEPVGALGKRRAAGVSSPPDGGRRARRYVRRGEERVERDARGVLEREEQRRACAGEADANDRAVADPVPVRGDRRLLNDEVIDERPLRGGEGMQRRRGRGGDEDE
jgi:hypothetical protein